jgi:hypothetical protein
VTKTAGSRKRRRPRPRQMTTAQKRHRAESRRYWQWQEAFKQAVDMLIKANAPTATLAKRAEKLASELVKIDEKHRPKSWDE